MWGGGGLYGIELIYIYTFSNLAATFIQSDLQMRTMEICIMCVCVFCFFANMIYSNAIFSSVFYQL